MGFTWTNPSYNLLTSGHRRQNLADSHLELHVLHVPLNAYTCTIFQRYWVKFLGVENKLLKSGTYAASGIKPNIHTRQVNIHYNATTMTLKSYCNISDKSVKHFRYFRYQTQVWQPDILQNPIKVFVMRLHKLLWVHVNKAVVVFLSAHVLFVQSDLV